MEILRILSINLREILKQTFEIEKFEEIRLRVNQPLTLRKEGKNYYVNSKGEITKNVNDAFMVNEKEIRESMEFISNFSMYAYQDEISEGYITIKGGHRVGICGQTITENGKIKGIKNIAFINIRIAHEIIGCSNKLLSYICLDNEFLNTLIISPPLTGKTTLLRDLIRNLSNGFTNFSGKNISVIDERSEIAAAFEGVPQNNLGVHTDVLDGMPKVNGIMIAVRTMSPEIVVVDEIGGNEDEKAIWYGINSGCKFLLSAHGNSIDEVKNKLGINDLIDKKIINRFIVIRKFNNIRNYEIYNASLIKIGDVYE